MGPPDCPAQLRERTAWTPCDLIFLLQRAPGEVEVLNPEKDSLLLRAVTMVSLRSPAGGATGQPTDGVMCGPGHVAEERGRVWRAMGSPGVRGSWESCWRSRDHLAGGDTPAPASTREREWHRVPPSHRLRRLASPLMSGLLSSSGLQKRGARGYATSPRSRSKRRAGQGIGTEVRRRLPRGPRTR